MQVHVGTSGFSYPEWRGSFYPEDLKPPEMLAYYAGRLGAVEINNTFYRLPREKVLRGWGDQVPEGFRFALKASRRITHQKRLKEADSETSYLLRTVAVLGDKLGALLFQLPPYLRKDSERLRDFLHLLPEGCRAALEFRHPSWFEDDVFEQLRARDLALVVSDTGKEDDAPLVATAGWGYLRLRREAYAAGELEEWARRIAGQSWRRAFIFFKHEDEGAGPRLADRFSGLLAQAAGDG